MQVKQEGKGQSTDTLWKERYKLFLNDRIQSGWCQIILAPLAHLKLNYKFGYVTLVDFKISHQDYTVERLLCPDDNRK